MEMNDIINFCNALRKKGDYYSNMVVRQSPLQVQSDYEVTQTENAIMFVETSNSGKRNLFFAASGKEALIDILSRVKEPDIAVSYIYRKKPDSEIREMFSEAGLSLYATYVRITTKYKGNPYLVEDKKPRRRILQEMYDAACGEYPSENDAEEIYEINMRNFDPISDDIFTIDEWREKIRKQEVLVYREEGKIVSYYNWRLEGNKLYGNISVNEGPANILYNLERRIFERYWEEGIRVFYAWFNVKNDKVLRRHNENAKVTIVTQQFIYQDIFCPVV